MNQYNIIIVEDDEITALNLDMSLQKQGYNIIAICDNANKAKDEIDKYRPDLIIIDISLQKSSDGIELASIIREKYGIPFIYLTSHSDDEIITKAKKTEPYGYIVKPFDPSSLHATIQMAVFKFDMENKRNNEDDFLKFDQSNLEKMLYKQRISDKPVVPFGGDYYLDINVNEIFYKNKKIKLTKKENAFLHILVAKLGTVISFSEALQYVWKENGATENSVRTLVWRLRNKLPSEVIKNTSGVGYYIENN
ncbi:MAG: transcriptional regulator [Sulfurimonas sp.]|nr:MAG: transcriptional regulator [Sulfurimonas sp.]